MSNSVGHSLIHQRLLHPNVLENQSKLNSSATVGASLSISTHCRSSLHQRKHQLFTKIYGDGFNKWRPKVNMSGKAARFIARAVLTTGAASEVIFLCLLVLLVFQLPAEFATPSILSYSGCPFPIHLVRKKDNQHETQGL